MRLLLDTHAYIWLFEDDPRLSATARKLLSDPRNTLLLSAVSCWEVSIKQSLGKLDVHRSPLDVADQGLREGHVQWLPLALAHCVQLQALPLHHRDPFDRMLIAQALAEDCAVLSADPQFDAYPVRRLW